MRDNHSPLQTVPHGTGSRFELEPGDEIRIATPDGAQGGDFSFPGFDQSVTRNALGWARFGRPWLVYSASRGDRLYDGDAEPVFELVAYEADGVADIMYPGCWAEVYDDRRPGCRDLISGALGVSRRELTGMLSFFISYEADKEAYRGLGPVELQPGHHLTLRALRSTPCAVSACPDVDIQGWQAGDLEVSIRAAS
ncbi:MAG: DUF1989 domain-containing protein [Actinomycetota bacterium]|nr:DUF1989 domain-containing protein [Actinomycetota bacterium]